MARTMRRRSAKLYSTGGAVGDPVQRRQQEAQHRIARGEGEQVVEAAILFLKARRRRATCAAHRIEAGAQRGEVGGARPLRRQRGHARLDHPARLDDGAKTRPDELQHERQRAGEVAAVRRVDHRPAAGARLDAQHALQLEVAQRLAQRAARDAVALDHLLLGEQLVARREAAAVDLAHDVLGQDRRGFRAPARGRRGAAGGRARLARAGARSCQHQRSSSRRPTIVARLAQHARHDLAGRNDVADAADALPRRHARAHADRWRHRRRSSSRPAIALRTSCSGKRLISSRMAAPARATYGLVMTRIGLPE